MRYCSLTRRTFSWSSGHLVTLNGIPWSQVCFKAQGFSEANLMSRTVFLRLLEYHTGILFLTTNRVENFDPAFNSRIHVIIHYDHLSRDSRAQIWKLCIIKALGEQPPWLDDAYLYVLALEELNGREIRNAVAVA